MQDLSQQILRTDASGMPLEWVDYRTAIKLHFLGHIAYSCGNTLFTIHGGINAKTRHRSQVQVNSIIATHNHKGASKSQYYKYTPPLSNRTLFQRDDHICMYCGNTFSHRALSRDHVTPVSQGGRDEWTNVVTACVRCNNHKAGRTPEQASMQLIAIPFVPTHAEYIYLQGRNILADQMEFLRAHFPRKSRLHQRCEGHS